MSTALLTGARTAVDAAADVLGSVGVTSLSVLAFLAAAQGVDLDLPPGTAAAVFLAVFPLRLLGPLPGGVGVVEPVLALALVAFGAGPTETVVAVVVHRLLTFWLPALPGAITFRRTQASLTSGDHG